MQDVVCKQLFFLIVKFTRHEPIDGLLLFFDSWSTLLLLGLWKIRECLEVDFLFPILVTEHNCILGLVLICIDIIVHMLLVTHGQCLYIFVIS